jgi:hypothetical protein
MKTCTKCKIEKLEEKFEFTPAGNRRGVCNSCRHQSRSEEYKARRRERGKAGQYRKYNLKRYGITPEQYEKIKEYQNNLCAICEQETKLFVDHDHVTKKVRGLLCHNCNSMLGQAKDSPHNLERAIRYLDLSS